MKTPHRRAWSALDFIAQLIADEQGSVYRSPSYVLVSSLSFFFIFGVFLMNVQLAQIFTARDSVDHATARAVDITRKSYCVNGENAEATISKANAALRPVLAMSVGCLLYTSLEGARAPP